MPPCRLNPSLVKVEIQKGTGADNIVITTRRRRRRRVSCFDQGAEQDRSVTMVANNFHRVTHLLHTLCLYIGLSNVRIG